MPIFTPTKRPKSVRNRWVIEVFFYCRFRVVTLLFAFFGGCRGICHRAESDLFPFFSLFLLLILDTIPLDLILFLWYLIFRISKRTNGSELNVNFGPVM